jgi:hypothetical protein
MVSVRRAVSAWRILVGCRAAALLGDHASECTSLPEGAVRLPELGVVHVADAPTCPDRAACATGADAVELCTRSRPPDVDAVGDGLSGTCPRGDGATRPATTSGDRPWSAETALA